MANRCWANFADQGEIYTDPPIKVTLGRFRTILIGWKYPLNYFKKNNGHPTRRHTDKGGNPGFD